ncbi:alpha/beta hydrolase family protein [Lentzea atacamensis]|uniref:Alpha/beta hydrolase family protein n=3 Tax=Pseudonocardiaceae TaxID=2070 RepID=A0A316I8E9_9PSEU|nr:alpha/beta hydrolase family protein [Lentzea atacamensis]RAS61809.1 alpha/beta hydrolase family protein [Lentzea atacamensis]
MDANAAIITSMLTVVLMHSPFLGPSSMRPLADELASDGVAVLLVDLQMTVNEAPVHQRLIGAFADALEDAGVTGPLVLVGHSGAGPLLPGFADALELEVAGLVFLDSDLPTPGKAWRETVDPALVRQVKASVRDGRLPRWDRWFDTDPLRLVPAGLREEMRDEAPEVPWEFLKEQRPVVEWSGACGYVLLSPVYEEAAARAEALGWPVERVESHHLAAATSPSAVAAALRSVISRL